MITFDEMLDAAEVPAIRDLQTEAFSRQDVVNLILQRSEIINDQPRPGAAIRAWSEGDSGPALRLVDQMGDTLIRRAAGIILLEYQEIKDKIDALAPSSIADIGCGYALFDLFFWRDHPGRVLLIDLEESDERHFGYQQTGAAYSSLKVARKFLTDNGVTDTDIVTCNPLTEKVPHTPPVDLAVSFISCGFHYPIQTYLDFFTTGVSETGAVILDLRARTAKEGMNVLKESGDVAVLTSAANNKARRIMLQKSPRTT